MRVKTYDLQRSSIAKSALLEADYGMAVVHLAWNREREGRRTLLFGAVELLPTEVPPPPDDYDPKGGVRLSSKSDHFLHVRHYVTTAQRALTWYAECRAGTARRPGDQEAGEFESEDPFVIADLAEEPAWPALICHQEPEFPFIAHWHLSPRLHHLIPAASRLPDWSDREHEAVMEHLKALLAVDFGSHAELLGSVSLIAPNPVLREFHIFPGPDRDREITLEFIPRTRASLDGLRVLVREDRPTGAGTLAIVDVERPLIRLEFGYRPEHTSAAILDPQRGLIFASKSYGFLDQIAMTGHLLSTKRRVQVPGTRRRKQEEYDVGVGGGGETTMVNPRHMPNSATLALYTGYYDRKAQSLGHQLDQRWVRGDPEGAAEIIRSKIRAAAKAVFIVDDFFTARELLRFGLAVSNSTVPIRILSSTAGLTEIGRREESMASTSSRPTETSRARAMAATLADVLSKPHANPISIRLMKGRPEVHDRFLIVDDQAWSLGSSLNEFGDRGTLWR